MKSLVLLLKLFGLLCLVIVLPSEAKIYDQCELACELHYSHGFDRSSLPNWICLVESESSYNTAAIHRDNKDGSTDYGLFQINSKYWCEDGYEGGKNVCGVRCKELMMDSIDKAVTCARQIYKVHGYTAWEGWKERCNGKPLPLLDHCFTLGCGDNSNLLHGASSKYF